MPDSLAEPRLRGEVMRQHTGQVRWLRGPTPIVQAALWIGAPAGFFLLLCLLATHRADPP